MLEFVEKIVYINLEHRTDRKAQIEEVLKDVSDKVVRFNAIKHPHGGIGCSQSHIAVLEMAQKKGWKNVLIIEDDAMWNNFEIGYPILEDLIQKPYDVIVLGSTHAIHADYKITKCQTTTAYIVNSEYYQTLLNNFKEGLNGLVTTGQYNTYELDQYWKRLQLLGNWYAVIPSLIIQRPGFSDIERRVVNYTKEFT